VATSQNGWPAGDAVRLRTWDIPGTARRIRLADGDAGWLLVDFAAWFHREIEPIDEGQLDDWGYAFRVIRAGVALSNHASGTAIDLNATRHPLGKRGTFRPDQVAKIRARLRLYDGCLRWGGDYTGRPDDMHIEINKPAGAVAAVAARLRGGAAPTEGDDELTPEQAQQLRLLCSQVVWGEKDGPAPWGWPTWNGGSGEVLTLVDYLRRANERDEKILQLLQDIAGRMP
jgi:hypothetical protein